LPRRDTRHTLLRSYGVFFLLCTLAAKMDIPLRHFDVAEVKLELGSRKNDKADMIRMAIRMGVVLPKTAAAGRDDAADAAAVWKCLIRLFAKQHLEKLDRAIYSNRGGLL
jgi:Holliday junction resolvasome RuvABC endonuclease subunit